MQTQFGMTELQDEQQYLQYRSLSGMAVVSLILAVLSGAAFLHPLLTVISVAAIVVAVLALRQTRSRAHELTGHGLAWIALVIGIITAVGGPVVSHIVYLQELPEGTVPISFAQLQPDRQHPELPIPPSALALNGQKVYVKGFVYPDGQKSGIKQFILIPDMGTCCFGGQPALTDMIEVTLRDPLRIQYSYQYRGLAGILKVSPQKKPINGLDGVYYELDAYLVR